MPAYEVSINDNPVRNLQAPDVIVAETDKTPDWYFQNINWVLSHYNQPANQISFPSAKTSFHFNTQKNPVEFMLRMMSYYLGEQPNMNFAHMTQNVTSNNMQALWINGHDVSVFVNYFKGIMMQKLAYAEFDAIPLSKDAVTKRNEKYNALMLKFDLKPYFKELETLGVNFNPEGNADFKLPQDVEKYLDTNLKEYSAIVMSDLANGAWKQTGWLHKTIQTFVYTLITGIGSMEHYVSNGKPISKPVPSYQLIWDNRFDNDYGEYDQFIGKIEPLTPQQIFTDSRFAELSDEQKLDIQQMAKDSEYGNKYNISQNILWWNYGTANQHNTVSVATVYFRGIKDTGKKIGKNIYGNKKIEEGKYGDKDSFKWGDIYKVTCIGNKYILNFGLADNLVENPNDKSYPCFPIQRFMPNTFMGRNVSEVARIFSMQDEIDMLNTKIREMIGREKGKVYMIDGSKFSVAPKEFFEDISSFGIHTTIPSGEAGNPTDAKAGVNLIDWTLDPNIRMLAELRREKKELMGDIMSASEIARGQQTKYVGLGVMQGTINQSNHGIAYLLDGYLDFIVRNMRYYCTMSKNLYASQNEPEISMLIGDRGVALLKFTKEMMWEYFNIVLTINNIPDEKKRERIMAIAQRDNTLTLSDYIKIESDISLLEMTEHLEYREQKKEQQRKEDAANQMKFEQMMSEQNERFKILLEETRGMNEFMKTKYSSDAAAMAKGISDIIKRMEADVPQQGAQEQPAQ